MFVALLKDRKNPMPVPFGDEVIEKEEIKGDEAFLHVRDGERRHVIRLVKERGGWKLSKDTPSRR